jgi:hypothetical protein
MDNSLGLEFGGHDKLRIHFLLGLGPFCLVGAEGFDLGSSVFAGFIGQLTRRVVLERSNSAVCEGKEKNGGKSRDVPLGETWRFDMMLFLVDFLQSVPP